MSETSIDESVLTADHRREIGACLEDVKGIVATDGVTRGALEKVKARVLELGARTDLFSFDRFPVLGEHDGAHSTIYQLAEDDDHTFALFAVSETEGNMSPPHDHTTWAVIAGIEGEELNKFYDRLDDGATPGHAKVQETTQSTVAAGSGVALMPDDIHSIHCVTDTPTLNFHLYGLSIAHLPERKMFNLKDGTYKVFPAQPNIVMA